MSSPAAVEILLTGGSGQVGTEITRLAPAGLTIVAPGRAELDMADPDSIARMVASHPWAAVINSAAYTAVDKAESDVVAAWKANALGPAALAQATAAAGIPLVHVSTDYVFDGSAPGAYDESDPVAPLGVYGASKLAGELAVRSGNPRSVVLRTAWVFSAHRANFLKTMLRVGAQNPTLRVVADQRGCPTSAADIAEALVTIALRMMNDPSAPNGTYHFVNSGEATWHEFAARIFAEQTAFTPPVVDAITTADYPTRARRPANSRLATARITRDFGVQPRPWEEAMRDVLAELKAETTR